MSDTLANTAGSCVVFVRVSKSYFTMYLQCLATGIIIKRDEKVISSHYSQHEGNEWINIHIRIDHR